MVKELNGKFTEFFQKDEIITVNKNIDQLLGAFNDFCEEGTKDENLENIIQLPENYSYFQIQSDIDPFDLTASAAAKDKYDVGIVFDPELGIQVLPFYGTFRQIFETEDYKSIKGYKECISDYFNNGKVPPSVIKRLYDEFGEKFLKIVHEAFELKEEKTIDELLHKYKESFFESRKFSSTTVLYASEAFSSLMASSMEMQQELSVSSSKVGRNDPCICGSGKKFKKCCM